MVTDDSGSGDERDDSGDCGIVKADSFDGDVLKGER